MGLDIAIAEWMNAHRSAAFDAIAGVLLWLGSALPGMALCALAIAALCWRAGRRDVLVTTYLSVAVVLVVNRILKLIIDRPRPGPEFARVATEGSAMPSTAAAVTSAGLIAMLLLVRGHRLQNAARAGAILLAATIGYAVVYLGAHWFTDVVAGGLLGTAVGLAARAASGALAAAARVDT